MNGRRCSFRVAPALGALAIGLAGCSAPPPERVVVVTIDTLRADRVGAYGHPGGLTPTIDALAASGTRFEDASAVAPVTLPSHASLFTGRYPTRTGVRNNGTFVLAEEETTLAERFREAGWTTGAVIASYPLIRRFGLAQGFTFYDDDIPTLQGSGARGFFPERDATRVTDRALALWEALGNGRKFLWVHYFDPHAPYAAPDGGGSARPDSGYDGEVAYVDRELGRLLEGIGADRKDTVVVVTSDHGEALGDHGERTHGVFVYQSTMRVPLVVRAPGRARAGAVVREPISLVDVYPTVLALAGIEPRPGIDGRDLRPALAGRPLGTRPVYGESFLPRLVYGFSELRMVRRGSLKYIDAPAPELFDLDDDPAETRDLAGRHADQDALVDDVAAFVASEDPEASGRSAGELDDATIANLRSLGYVSGPTAPSESSRGLDPKQAKEVFADHDRALALLSSGSYDDAVALLRSLRARSPEHLGPGLQSAIATGLLAAGRLDEAEREIRLLLAEAPQLVDAHLMLADLGVARRDVSLAERACRAAITVDPRHGRGWFRLGEVLAEDGRYTEAAEALLQAARLEPSEPRFADAVVDLAVDRGRPEMAAERLEDLARGGREGVAVWVAAARARRIGADYSAAERDARRALELAPQNPSALMEIGEIALASGRAEDADRLFASASRSAPWSARAHLGRARALALGGKPGEAQVEVEAAFRLEPRNPDLFTVSGELAERRGDLSAAARNYRQALHIDPTHRGAWEGLQRTAGGR